MATVAGFAGCACDAMGRCVLGSAWGTKHQAAPRQQGSQSTERVNARTRVVLTDGMGWDGTEEGDDGDQLRYIEGNFWRAPTTRLMGCGKG